MANPYAQAALTYPRHIGASGIWGFITLALMLMALVVLGTVIADSGTMHSKFMMLAIVVLFSMSLWQMIVAHARDQFANPRAHLMPNFRDAHFAILAALASIVVLLIPVTFTCLAGFRSIIPVALSVFLCGAALPQPRWLTAVLSMFKWVLVLTFFVVANHWREQLLSAQFVSGQLECPALIALVLGAAMAVSGGRRLARMNEDMADYRPCRSSARDAEQQIDRAARRSMWGPSGATCGTGWWKGKSRAWHGTPAVPRIAMVPSMPLASRHEHRLVDLVLEPGLDPWPPGLGRSGSFAEAQPGRRVPGDSLDSC